MYTHFRRAYVLSGIYRSTCVNDARGGERILPPRVTSASLLECFTLLQDSRCPSDNVCRPINHKEAARTGTRRCSITIINVDERREIVDRKRETERIVGESRKTNEVKRSKRNIKGELPAHRRPRTIVEFSESKRARARGGENIASFQRAIFQSAQIVHARVKLVRTESGTTLTK